MFGAECNHVCLKKRVGEHRTKMSRARPWAIGKCLAQFQKGALGRYLGRSWRHLDVSFVTV